MTVTCHKCGLYIGTPKTESQTIRAQATLAEHLQICAS